MPTWSLGPVKDATTVTPLSATQTYHKLCVGVSFN